jgi:hypothetical protein
VTGLLPSRAVTIVAAVAVGVALTGACGSSDDVSTTCLRAHDAQVCSERSDGSVQLSAEGLLPGSDLLVDRTGGEPLVIEVGDDGRPLGATGFLAATTADPLVLVVSGTAADGSAVEGEIVEDGG